MKLYFAPGTAAMISHWLLLEMKVSFDLVAVDLQAGEHKCSEYLALNPAGTVPTLRVDGQSMTESAAILLWLTEHEAGQKFAPSVGSPQRMEFLQHLVNLANTLQPAFRRWFYPQEAAGESAAEQNKANAQQLIESQWTLWNQRLADREYLLGERLSAIDIYLCTLMRWSRNMPKPATDWPQLAAFAARMKQRPSFRNLYEREGLTDWA